ncbi:hypothetical protein AKI39_23555 [Bordetella sp. H567]|uniref:hypothetical protein n=1 Tax=Bordetella sp. H567 TaxID=1697043 RepID=UPI00081C9B85|nr:hypothetical protein [Bordetella sp. H567]AOB33089.1 hypothetical protein AKI39_23555 [Bordetella sp. H567]
MKQCWKKLGQIYCPATAGRHPKLVTHAANPLPILLEGDIYRIFFCGRDASNRSSIGAVDIDIVSRTVVRDHFEPIFEYGPPGSFYADGVSIGGCYTVSGLQYMLFMGWQTPLGGQFRGDIGRLVLDTDLGLTLESNSPFLGSDPTDPISLSYPWVTTDDEGNYLMLYGSTLTWDAGNGEMLHVIHLATSVNGHDWARKGAAVPHSLGIAQAFSRPTVARTENGGYQMWFSYRGPNTKYRIGYAESADGHLWRLDLENAGIDVSASGWDSEMIEYPCVFDHLGVRYMLYNGNSYGKTGFGLAVMAGER